MNTDQAPRGEATLVCGPPASGKSTYVRERWAPGDMVIDVDLIWRALAGTQNRTHPAHLLHYVLVARDAILRELATTHRATPRTWIIGGLPKKKEREALARSLQAKIVILPVHASECLERISSDPSRKGAKIDWKGIVKNWWDEYEPGTPQQCLTELSA